MPDQWCLKRSLTGDLIVRIASFAGSARMARLGVTDEHQAGHLNCVPLFVTVGGAYDLPSELSKPSVKSAVHPTLQRRCTPHPRRSHM